MTNLIPSEPSALLQRFTSCWSSSPPLSRHAAEARLKWLKLARPNQLPPERPDWHTWLLLAGRGFGKTRAGAEELAWQALLHDNWRCAVVAPTAQDARDTCVEGESGLLAVLPPELVATWNRSLGELILTNGSRFKLYSADAPERLRGPQHHVAWCDEVGAWRSSEAMDQLRFGLRLGVQPRTIITTTPRPTALLRSLMQQVGQGVALARGSTFENAGNLAPAALAELKARYGGTRLGQQELYAVMLEQAEGALWPRGQVEALRVLEVPPLQRIVIAIDPAVTHGAEADLTGIVSVGRCAAGHAYVLRDVSARLSPDGWARRVVRLYQDLEADLVIGEVNQGGDMVEAVLRTVAPHLPFKAVVASRGKALRAEPVAALYEQGLVHHVGMFTELEDEMARFTNAGVEGSSPDRVDALVWALTELMLGTSVPKVRTV